MSRLSSRQRKLVYFVAILLLLIPIFVLGRPSSRDSRGGVLAELRRPQGQELGLSEHNLGRVDPTSAAMNLVLLGMRGVAVNLLWMDYIEQQKTKNWAQVRSTTESITMLQPHYLQIWRYHGWNLAYNVAAEWDDVRDRYYWIKEGAKFINNGTEYNQFSPELNFEIGRIIGQKIGVADEWRVYRKYFNPDGRQFENVPEDEKGDPDPRYRGGFDPVLNPDRVDNFLAAQKFYQIANELEARGFQQHLMMRHIFRQYPYRCRLDNNGVLNREGYFRLDEVLSRYEDLITEDLTVEEALWGLLLVKKIDELLERPPADDLPLSGLWNRHLNDKVPTMQFNFNRRFGGL